jgi:hypothetical protein
MTSTQGMNVTKVFAREILGKRGTVVFGGGVPALTGTITFQGANYVVLVPVDNPQPHLIQLESIVYFRLAKVSGSDGSFTQESE